MAGEGGCGVSGAEIRDLTASVMRVEGALQTQTALLEAHNSANHEKFGVAFEKIENHDERLRKVEQKYVPRDDMIRFEDETKSTIDSIRSGLSRVTVACAVLAAAGGGVGAAVVQWLMGAK